MEKSLKFTAIVQARLSSSRLPNKVIAKINSKSVIEIIHERLKCSKLINDIIVAIPENEKNLEIFLKRKKIKFFLGSNSNVLERYYKCAKKHNSDFVVRVTADCPLIDPNIIDMMIKNFIRNKDLDLLTNNHPPTYPDGLDISIFTFDLLKKTYLSAKNNFDREHVVPHMLRSKNIKKKKYY